MPKVSIADTDKVFEVNDNDIIYDSLCDQGEELPHGCLSGSCGACRIDVISGFDSLVPAGYIENNTIDCLKEEFSQKFGKEFISEKKIRLACRARVKGDVVIRSLK